MHLMTKRRKASRKKFDCLIRYTLIHFFARGKGDHRRVKVMYSMKHLCDKILFRQARDKGQNTKKIHNQQ